MATTRTSTKSTQPRDKLLPKLTMFLFGKKRTVLVAWLVIVVFGILSYTTLLRREGFPSINIPYAIVTGTYIVNDPTKVDAEVAKPITDIALKQDKVSTVQTQSAANFFTIAIQYKDGVDSQAAAKKLQSVVESQASLPASAKVTYNVPYFGVTGGEAKKIDATISFFSPTNSATTEQLTQKAEQAAEYLNRNKSSLVKEYFARSPYQAAVNPLTGQSQVIQKTFDRYGKRENNQTHYYDSVTIGVTAIDGADVIKLDKQVQDSISQLLGQSDFKDFDAHISASYAPAIKDEISELQRVLLEGLIAVLVVGSVVIAVRASLITIISMITVITATLGFIYLIGYTLNVITLFALILGLSLIVDDTIIMIEAIDASRRHHTKASEAVATAISKISRAMVAATFTSVLSFAPLLFAGGVLGTFIRAIPITIIAALLISLLVALIFIPQFARYVILGKKQMGERGVKEFAAGFEAAIARFICKPMLWARGSQKKLLSVGITAVVIGLLFVGAAGFVFTKVTFNLFPPTKDTNGITLNIVYPAGTTLLAAQGIVDQADKIAAEVIGPNFIQASYFGMATPEKTMGRIEIVSYNKRAITSPEIVKQLQARYDKEFTQAVIKVGQEDVGPPSSGFTVQIKTENRDAGYRLAQDLASYLKTAELKRTSGKVAHFTNVSVSSSSQLTRNDGKLSINVSAFFDGDDTTTLVTLAQNDVKKQFDNKKLAGYGLPSNAIDFNLGQESDNQNSFKTLVIAFPILLVVIYFLLAIQFRSLLQPLLIFMAVPFSLLGITLGLYLTDNAFSFFVAMGFFALIGLSIKNTILLTDYANQSRHNGMGVIDSTVAALGERFRPLIATSLTAVVSLIPLALTSPFWQGLAVVLIFGLLSSTTLVVTVFPYYYLGGEFLRTHISRKQGISWVILTGLLIYGAAATRVGMLALLAPVVAGAIVWGVRRLVRK